MFRLALRRSGKCRPNLHGLKRGKSMKRNKSNELLGAVDRLLAAAAKLEPKRSKSSAIKGMIAAVSQLADATSKLLSQNEPTAANATDHHRHHPNPHRLNARPPL